MSLCLVYAIVGVVIIGSVSISLAAILSFSVLHKMLELLISLSVGMMLATSLLHALPEAYEQIGSAKIVFVTLLIGLLGFFLLERTSIIRHSHHHEHDGHHHESGFDKKEAGHEGWMILLGHAFHSVTDGVLIVASFKVNMYLGIITCLAILAHEIPQQTSDFIVMLNAGFSKKRAFCFSFINMFTAAIGCVAGFFVLGAIQQAVPYVLVLASAGFIYIALSDLVPQMHRHATAKETLWQVLLVFLGIAIIYTIMHVVHHVH